MQKTFVIGCQPLQVPELPPDLELLDWADNFSELAEEKQQLALAVP